MKKNKSLIEKHKILAIEPLEEIYPETNRKLIRPKVNFVRAIFFTILVIISIGLLSWGILKFLSIFEWYQEIAIPWDVQFIILYILGLILSICVFSKSILIFIIRLYQKYAPYEIRSRCVFIPCCSEYMILAIKKYGLIKGVKKGRDRFNRCHGPNGGEDYP